MQMNRPPNGCSVRPDFKNYSADCSAIYYKLCISHFHPGFSRVRDNGDTAGLKSQVLTAVYGMCGSINVPSIHGHIN